MSKGDIPISNLVMSQVQATRVLHFTGGLICLPLEEGGWALGPIGASQEGLSFLSPMPEGQVHMLARQEQPAMYWLQKRRAGIGTSGPGAGIGTVDEGIGRP